ncbi:MATE family efflux transporter [uncultured Victivallis sp.]|uniref:MATE family efflux transporter n=1 Tax=uncultured Victivallis sp. TaxID=354118 RepID=UPI0025EFA7B8|nr:MATE family efflux transporter [uncultured Victivallis sp.]
MMRNDQRLFWKYVAPSVFGALIGGSFAIVDAIFIGLSGGKNALAAAAVTWPVVMLLQAFGFLVGSGGAVLISQSRGANDAGRESGIFSRTVFLAFAWSAVLTLLCFPILRPVLAALGATEELMPVSLRYAQILTGGVVFSIFMSVCLEVIRNDGHPTLSMLLMVTGLLSNIVLDWVFVFLCGCGAVGAAIATVVSQGGACLLGAIYFCSPLTRLRFTGEIFRPALREIIDITVTGLPIFGNMLSIIAMLYMHNAQSLRYGGIDGLAAYTVISSLEALGSMFMTGIAGGVQPLSASMYGAGKYKRQNRFGNYGYLFAFISGVLLMLFSFAMHKFIPGWMGLADGEARNLAMRGILLSAPAFLLLGVIRVAAFYYQSTGAIAKSSFLIYGDSFAALPLCIFTLPLWLGMDGVWLAMPVSRILLMMLLLYFWFGMKRYREKNENREKKICPTTSH